jgi:hypothetical protein
MCPLCNRAEVKKSVHLRLDSEGDVIVAPPVYSALLAVPGTGGLEVVNTVSNPPELYVGAVAMPKQHIVQSKLNPQQNTEPFYVPGRTQYESRDRMPKLRIPKLRVMRKKKVI